MSLPVIYVYISFYHIFATVGIIVQFLICHFYNKCWAFLDFDYPITKILSFYFLLIF